MFSHFCSCKTFSYSIDRHQRMPQAEEDHEEEGNSAFILHCSKKLSHTPLTCIVCGDRGKKSCAEISRSEWITKQDWLTPLFQRSNSQSSAILDPYINATQKGFYTHVEDLTATWEKEIDLFLNPCLNWWYLNHGYSPRFPHSLLNNMLSRKALFLFNKPQSCAVQAGDACPLYLWGFG